MLIGIDGNEANVFEKVGISEFAYELLVQFSQFSFTNSQFSIFLKDKPRDDMPGQTVGWKYRILKPGKLWTQWRLPLDLYLHQPRPDLFFTPSHYAPRFSPIPTVVSVMDLSYLYFPELFKKSDLHQLKSWTSYSVKKAKAVITISKSSRNDIIKLYGKEENRVFAVYPGVKTVTVLEPHIYSMSELSTKYSISNNYILFVGTLQPRKNVERLIEAFAKVLQLQKKVQMKQQKMNTDTLELVIIGKRGWLYEGILKAPEKYAIANKVKFLDFVPNEDLPLFYKNALCFVLPSLYEGFGLPILEAMQNDCPVITSNISSMPEAGGGAVLYINPADTDDIAGAINKLTTDEKLRKELIEKGRKQVKKFSWDKAAKETLRILEQTAAEK